MKTIHAAVLPIFCKPLRNLKLLGALVTFQRDSWYGIVVKKTLARAVVGVRSLEPRTDFLELLITSFAIYADSGCVTGTVLEVLFLNTGWTQLSLLV
jgi:hypothetical protein